MFRIISLSDTVTKCDCCGKSNLKKTVVLTESESNFPGSDEVQYFGQSCAQTALRNSGAKGYRNERTTKEMNTLASLASTELKKAQCKELIDTRKVVVIAGCFCLVTQTCLSRDEQRSNLIEMYQCFN